MHDRRAGHFLVSRNPFDHHQVVVIVRGHAQHDPKLACPCGDEPPPQRAGNHLPLTEHESETMLTENPNAPWSNWAANKALIPYRHCHPQTLQDAVTVVEDAEAEGKRVRELGSSWAFTDILIGSDYLVKTDRLNHPLITVVPNALHATGRGQQLVQVKADIKLVALCNILECDGPSPLWMGADEGQCVAGVLCTSVHGPELQSRTGMRHTARGPSCWSGGIQHWIEPSMGVTDPSAL